jgi:hypothetical protein
VHKRAIIASIFGIIFNRRFFGGAMTSSPDPSVLDARGHVLNMPIHVGGVITLRGYGDSRVVAVSSVHLDRVVVLICPSDIEGWAAFPRESSLRVVVRPADMYLSGVWAWRYPWIK